MSFELTNEQRTYFGLEPTNSNWVKVSLKGDTYRPDSIIYFDGDVIKKHIVSTNEKYEEKQYNDRTRERNYLLPLTSKGKEKKLTASVLESRQPQGVYCYLDGHNRVLIGNYDTQTTFYDSWWDNHDLNDLKPISECVSQFVVKTPSDHLSNITAFKKSKRKNVKFKQGDIFAFKVNLTEYGFGRVLLNIDEIKKENLISKEHGLSLIMGKPVLIKFYVYITDTKSVNIEHLISSSSLPSDYIFDNKLFYGEYEIIGNKPITTDEINFPISYGKHIDSRRNSVFFQWGLINIELPFSSFNKYLTANNPFVSELSPSRKVINPYGYYSVGFSSIYDGKDIKEAVLNKNIFDYQNKAGFRVNFDLRNPKNQSIRNEIMKAFDLDPHKSYDENCIITETIGTIDILKT
jgi:hypothetical protein